MTQAQSYVLEVQHDAATDDYYIQFTDQMLSELGWFPGDQLLWTQTGEQQWTLTRSTQSSTS